MKGKSIVALEIIVVRMRHEGNEKGFEGKRRRKRVILKGNGLGGKRRKS